MRCEPEGVYWFVDAPEGEHYTDNRMWLFDITGYATKERAINSVMSYFVCDMTWEELESKGYKVFRAALIPIQEEY